ncbi:MAG: hypothetical protein AAF431_08425 [Pseudomonadota bacterium]
MKTIVSIFIVFLYGCTPPRYFDPSKVAAGQELLKDCTELVSKDMSWNVPQTEPSLRRDAVVAASIWAQEMCYLPCSYKMCATITKNSNNKFSVYISAEPPSTSEELIVLIGPEAEVTFDKRNFRMTDQKMWHSGCRFSEDDCEWLRKN